jgi:hypothetical protein
MININGVDVIAVQYAIPWDLPSLGRTRRMYGIGNDYPATIECTSDAKRPGLALAPDHVYEDSQENIHHNCDGAYDDMPALEELPFDDVLYYGPHRQSSDGEDGLTNVLRNTPTKAQTSAQT